MKVLLGFLLTWRVGVGEERGRRVVVIPPRESFGAVRLAEPENATAITYGGFEKEGDWKGRYSFNGFF